jgi:hypothetical protein
MDLLETEKQLEELEKLLCYVHYVLTETCRAVRSVKITITNNTKFRLTKHSDQIIHGQVTPYCYNN